ncbi:hypothetical protein GCM10011320_33210 [Neoroseomonas lacus]|uniref:Uncharacterized protein n=1 Tax=Neoroseomonas lacus TaxID=287609 RepID=A0A917KT17_9PROT|nr:hypothetical protein GCM10011320_33210 [Neoroseomonas lacus]
MVGFAVHREAGGAHRVDRGGGLVGQAGGKGKQRVIIHRPSFGAAAAQGQARRWRAPAPAPALAARRHAA